MALVGEKESFAGPRAKHCAVDKKEDPVNFDETSHAIPYTHPAKVDIGETEVPPGVWPASLPCVTEK